MNKEPDSGIFELCLCSLRGVIRIFEVSLTCILIAILIAFFFHTFLVVALRVAALCEFIVTTCSKYVLPNSWLFRNGDHQMFAANARRYLELSLSALLARLFSVLSRSRVLDTNFPLLVLGYGAGTLFFINYKKSRAPRFSPCAITVRSL